MAGKLAKLAQQAGAVENVVEVWEENWQSVSFFLDYCATQWRTGMGGATGLDYTAVIASLRTLRIGRERFDEVFADVRVMESAALEAMAKK
jgi:hypothetical protein